MSFGQALLIAVVLALLLYGAVIVTLVGAGRGVEARAFAWFVPDCLVLFQRLLLRGSGRRLVVEHWPGPMRSLRVLTRLAY